MKKKFSFILAVIMLVANFAVTTITAEEKTMFTDVTSETQYAEAILTLAKLGIINGYDENGEKLFKPEGGITRAEFAAIITRAMGIADAVGGVCPFTDVPETHWAIKNIIASTDRGITNGMGDGTFHPDDNVTYEQAIKMVVCAMNYTLSAEAGGGWPDGYFNQGTILGLTKNIGAGVLRTNPAPRGVVAQIVYNALDIKVADVATSTPTKDTFLNKFLRMEMITGKVVGIEEDVTSECEYELARDEMAILPKNDDVVLIDFEDYEDKDNLLQYLGQEVLVFYKIASSGSVNKLVILDSDVTENETTKITYDEIISYNNGKIEYYNESGRKTNIDFKENEATIYYNKKSVTSGISKKLDEWLEPTNESTFIYGEVVLTDSGADGSIDMVEIMDYDYLVALRAPSSSDYVVTNKMKFKDKSVVERVIDSITLNPDKKSYSFVIEDQNGKKIETTGIKANNVVLVAASEAEDYFTVKVSNEVVDGTVRAFSADDNTIQISDKEYKITNDCIEYLKDQGTELENGKKGKFYLDAFGNVAYATLNVNTESTTVMYLITAYYDEDTDNGQLRGFVPGSGYKTYSIDRKVRLDGTTLSPEEAVETLRENSKNFVSEEYLIKTSSNANQLIKIELEGTTAKEIASIDVSKDGTTEDASGLLLYHVGPKKYNYASNTFTTQDKKDKFYVNNNTIFITVPTDRTVTTGYYKRTNSYFSVSGSPYILEPINVDEANRAEIVLVYMGASEEKVNTKTTAFSVLAKDPKDEFVDDEVLKQFEFYTNNTKLVEKTVDDEEDVDDMRVGDIFRYITNGEGRAADVQVGMAYEDILAVLEEKESKYDWTTIDGCISTNDSGKPYNRSDGSGKPYASAYMYNLVSVDDDGLSIIVTRNGFVDGKLPEDAETELIQINTSTKILKMNEDGDELISVSEDSEVEFTVEDLKSAEYEDDKCSKIAVLHHANAYAKLIIIYE